MGEGDLGGDLGDVERGGGEIEDVGGGRRVEGDFGGELGGDLGGADIEGIVVEADVGGGELGGNLGDVEHAAGEIEEDVG